LKVNDTCYVVYEETSKKKKDFDRKSKEIEMNKTRFPYFIIGVALILAAIFALQAFVTFAGTKESNQSYVGMGDLRVFERSQSVVLISDRPYTGMGDLKYFEALQIVPLAGGHFYTGMGDLRYFEGLHSVPLASNRSYSGMGDLQRLEALQEGRIK
jgi:hypothetical protein